MTPHHFIAKWQQARLSERSACQQHFLDLCELLGQPKPAEADPEGAWDTFERGVRKTAGGSGWADVWMRGHFGWEYKGKHKDLAAAYRQLLLYREDLENPPLLVVCDMDRIEIHTNCTGTAKQVHRPRQALADRRALHQPRGHRNAAGAGDDGPAAPRVGRRHRQTVRTLRRMDQRSRRSVRRQVRFCDGRGAGPR